MDTAGKARDPGGPNPPKGADQSQMETAATYLEQCQECSRVAIRVDVLTGDVPRWWVTRTGCGWLDSWAVVGGDPRQGLAWLLRQMSAGHEIAWQYLWARATGRDVGEVRHG